MPESLSNQISRWGPLDDAIVLVVYWLFLSVNVTTTQFNKTESLESVPMLVDKPAAIILSSDILRGGRYELPWPWVTSQYFVLPYFIEIVSTLSYCTKPKIKQCEIVIAVQSGSRFKLSVDKRYLGTDYHKRIYIRAEGNSSTLLSQFCYRQGLVYQR